MLEVWVSGYEDCIGRRWWLSSYRVVLQLDEPRIVQALREGRDGFEAGRRRDNAVRVQIYKFVTL